MQRRELLLLVMKSAHSVRRGVITRTDANTMALIGNTIASAADAVGARDASAAARLWNTTAIAIGQRNDRAESLPVAPREIHTIRCIAPMLTRWMMSRPEGELGDHYHRVIGMPKTHARAGAAA
jgi:hypothetical protein